MFVKIKMEPKSSRALETLKDVRYISLDDDATITQLKLEIEQYVNIAAEKQDIRTLTTSYANSRRVKDLCDDRGSSIMLYAFNDYSYDNEEPRFICFLQMYSDESCLKLQERELQHSSTMLQARKNLSSSGTLITVSETESSESSSEESDSDSSGSSDGAATLSGRRKRKISTKENVNPKRFKAGPGLDTFSPTVCQFLDEFPKSHSLANKSNYASNSCVELDNSKTTVKSLKNNQVDLEEERNLMTATIPFEQNRHQQDLSICNPSKELRIKESYNSPTNSTAENTHISKTASNETSNVNSLNNASVSQKSPAYHPSISSNLKHPCYSINPETRQFALCMCKDAGDIQNSEFENLLEWFFKKFSTSELPHQLEFEKQSPITNFDGKIWIACMNSETLDWVLLILSQYTLHSYEVEKLCNGDGHNCKVVIPKVVQKGKSNLLETFKLLEKQNPNLSTLRWCVKDSRILKGDEPDFQTEAVSALCNNELIYLWVDKNSKEFLEQTHKKIKYCFWEIVFKFE